jgi:hypothetical protein
MKIKLDADGHPVLDDGKVVYIADDGREFPIDGGHLYTRVRDLTVENTGHRAKFTEAEGKLKAFEGIEDPAAALAALQTVANLGSGELVAAGKIDEIRAAAKKAAEETIADAMKSTKGQLSEALTQRDTAVSALYDERIGGAFDRSPFIKEKVAVPTDMLRAAFGPHFKSEDGKTVARDANNSIIYSRANPGEVAGFEEAIEQLINAYPNRDNILKGIVKEGGGAQSQNQGPGGVKTMPRSMFDRLDPTERSAKMKDGFTLTEG